jgi:hypothetical protein
MIKGLSKEDIVGKIFYGQVVDNNDPEQEGQCKIRVFGVFDDIEDENLPWAAPGSSKVFGGGEDGGFGDISIPKNDALVRVSFAEGDLYSPEWHSLAYVNQAVKDEIADSYLNSHVLAYDVDEQLKIFYTPSKGVEIFLKQSHITINPDASITIEHANSQSIIELVGSDCNITTQANVNVTCPTKIEETAQTCIINGITKTQLGPVGNFGAVGAEPLWAFLKALSAAVDLKWPPTPGVNSSAAAAAEVASTSKIVKVTVP